MDTLRLVDFVIVERVAFVASPVVKEVDKLRAAIEALPDIDPSALETALAIINAGSYGKAAKALGITKAAIAKKVNKWRHSDSIHLRAIGDYIQDMQRDCSHQKQRGCLTYNDEYDPTLAKDKTNTIHRERDYRQKPNDFDANTEAFLAG